jgi:hypothetical protein
VDLGAEFGGELAQLVLPAGDERDAVPARREFTGEVGADSRGCPGDDSGLWRISRSIVGP